MDYFIQKDINKPKLKFWVVTLHWLPCIFLFFFSWPKVLAQSPTSLCYMLLVDVLRTNEAGMSLYYMLLVDVLRTHEAGMPSHVTCKK